jgi:deoxycytidylate deaminase
MAEFGRQTKMSMDEQQTSSDTSLLSNIQKPEIFFGLVAPIGVNTKEIADKLQNALSKVGYSSTYLKITKLMQSIPTGVELHESPLDRRYNSYIEYANSVRKIIGASATDKAKGNDALAMLSVAAIQEARKRSTGDEKIAQHGHAYILDQFKRPEEIALLRKVYGRLFIQISVQASKKTRLSVLKRGIKKSHSEGGAMDYTTEAESLIRRDLSEEDVPNGQRLRDAFPMADAVVDANDRAKCQIEIERFINILFGHNFITPTHDEYAMYAAKSASLRSADLSRQVGAAIFSESGEVITLGANEVPKPGGGTFFEGDQEDQRDFNHGADYNEQEKYGIVTEFVQRLDSSGCLSDKVSKSNSLQTLDQKVDYILEGEDGPKLKTARVMDLLEFGRQVHAEMNAICDAARLGKSVKGPTLYCTTFPCHMCAKLILASGITRVVYVEPYPKSYAEDMYSQSIALEQSELQKNQILFQPFSGIAPFRYRDLFEKGRRKSQGGTALTWKEGSPRPNLNLIVESYLELEPLVTAQLAKRIDSEKNAIPKKS